ncbi:putative F-box protein PP2-B2 [Cardamine amara subsp. amara]|uniref:F-box protein PP2-B2 n=1 Tax=Cardamine amara subsp. amara TaxID=228776 RepID=A0ABD1C011_CARAN
MGQNHGVGSRGETRQSSFNDLSEYCISNILSFTSPRDACVVALVSKTFKSAAKSDIVWEKFLPPDYSSLVPQSRVFSSKKELYLALCDDPVPMEDGKKVHCMYLSISFLFPLVYMIGEPMIKLEFIC